MKRIFSIFLVFTILFGVNALTIVSSKAINLPVLKIITQPNKEYKNGETIKFTVQAPNYTGKVEYRVILYNGTTKQTINLWNTPKTGYYYRGWQPAGTYKFDIKWSASQLQPGPYSMTVLVRRANTTKNYDSHVDTNSFYIIGQSEDIAVEENDIIEDQDTNTSKPTVYVNGTIAKSKAYVSKGVTVVPIEEIVQMMGDTYNKINAVTYLWTMKDGTEIKINYGKNIQVNGVVIPNVTMTKSNNKIFLDIAFVGKYYNMQVSENRIDIGIIQKTDTDTETVPNTSQNEEDKSPAPTKEMIARTFPTIKYTSGIQTAYRAGYEWDGKSQFISEISGWKCPDISEKLTFDPAKNPEQYYKLLSELYGMHYNKYGAGWNMTAPKGKFLDELAVAKNIEYSVDNNYEYNIGYLEIAFEPFDVKISGLQDIDRLPAIFQQILKSVLPNDYMKVWEFFYRDMDTKDYLKLLNTPLYLPNDNREIAIRPTSIGCDILIGKKGIPLKAPLIK